MFKKRLRVYQENLDLLTIKQRDFSTEGRKFVEEELRSQRLIGFYCDMCQKAEQSGINNKSKAGFVQLGQSLKYELKKQDKIEDEEEKIIMANCDQANGDKAHLYEKMDAVLNKILSEVNVLHQERKNQIIKVRDIKWSNVEIAQLLVAVFNLGEGEWFEIQRRIDFSSSGFVKTPNQVAYKWKGIKKVMSRDMLKMKHNNQKIVSKHEWIIQTLRTMNSLDPQNIGLKESHF